MYVAMTQGVGALDHRRTKERAITQSALPEYHIRPSGGWLNDPNGMTSHGGRWHVFYQHNPAAAVHADIHWGHVSSTDLVTWREHPVAFGPRPGAPDAYGAWSGVFVPGLARPAVVYTGVTDASQHSSVCLRTTTTEDDGSLDRWSSPTVVATTPRDAGVAVMRDPFVFTAGDRRWALLGAGLDDGSPALLLFGCDDALAWTYEGIWRRAADLPVTGFVAARIWECPQLVRVDDRWVLVLSLHTPGTWQVVAIVGELVGAAGDAASRPGTPGFRPVAAQLLDEGDGLYAPQVCVDDAGDPLLFGWVRQDGSPGGSGLVAGCLSLPRRVRVAVDDRVVTPFDVACLTLLEGPESVLPTGTHALPRRSRIAVTGGAGRLVFRGDGPAVGQVPVDAGPGTQVWLDGEVLEAYPTDASGTQRAAATYRRVGTSSWRVDVPDALTATVTAVARSTPAR